MKLIAVTAAAILLGLSAVLVANAAPSKATISVIGKHGCPATPPGPCDGLAHANWPTDLDVSIVGGAPIVPYEYSLENRCWFDGKTSGPSDSYERFDLIGPWFDIGGAPHTTVTVNNNPVPSGKCKAVVMRGSTAQKDAKTYDIVP